MHAIETLRKVNAGLLKYLPQDVTTSFVPRELRRALWDEYGKINRNAWEMGLALAIKDALRSGDLYLPQSKQHVSFWELVLNERAWSQNKKTSFEALQQAEKEQVKDFLIEKLVDSAQRATKRFKQDQFDQIQNGKLFLKAYERVEVPDSVHQLPKAIDASIPSVRIEQLLMQVDRLTRFSDHFIPTTWIKASPFLQDTNGNYPFSSNLLGGSSYGS